MSDVIYVDEVQCAAIGCNPCDYVNYPESWPVGQDIPSEETLAACFTTTTTAPVVEVVAVTPVEETTTTTVFHQEVWTDVETLPRTGGTFLIVLTLLAIFLCLCGRFFCRVAEAKKAG